MAQITCRYCGSLVDSVRVGQVRCGAAECKKAYNRDAVARARARVASTRPPKACRGCGESFKPDPPHKSYCGDDCQRGAHLKRRRDTEYAPPARHCDLCGGEIPYKSWRRRYCSPDCQKAGVAREARWRVKGLPPGTVLPDACRLCGSTGRRLVIDHDHGCCPGKTACGQCFRGMLCQPCNVALGMLQESPDLLRRAAEYIEHHRERQQAT